MGKGSHHVVPNPKCGWNVKKGGSKRSSGHFEHKIEAEKAGRKISRNQEPKFIIHGNNPYSYVGARRAVPHVGAVPNVGATPNNRYMPKICTVPFNIDQPYNKVQ